MNTKEAIITEIYTDSEYKSACRKITKGDELHEDLFQELVCILYAYDEAKLVAIYERGEIKWFVVAIISRMWHSPPAPVLHHVPPTEYTV